MKKALLANDFNIIVYSSLQLENLKSKSKIYCYFVFLLGQVWLGVSSCKDGQ